jgi:hypothetical protein
MTMDIGFDSLAGRRCAGHEPYRLVKSLAPVRVVFHMDSPQMSRKGGLTFGPIVRI